MCINLASPYNNRNYAIRLTGNMNMCRQRLSLYSIKRLLTPLKYRVFENIMENGAFALLEQMLHFLLYFQKYSKLNINFS